MLVRSKKILKTLDQKNKNKNDSVRSVVFYVIQKDLHYIDQ